MGALLGLDAVAYYLTTGSRATWGAADANGFNAGAAPASLSAMNAIKDVGTKISVGKADVSTRGNKGWKATLATLKEMSTELAAVWDSTDAGLVALIKAFNLKKTIAIALLEGDKATSGVTGFWADWMVVDIGKDEKLEEGQMFTVTIEPALTAVPPEWVKTT